jgi:WD40 repeat protein
LPGADNDSIHLWDTRKGVELPAPSVQGRVIVGGDGQLLILREAEGATLLHDAIIGKVTARWPLGALGFSEIITAPGGKMVALGKAGMPIRLWEPGSNRAHQLPAGQGNRDVPSVFDPTGKLLAVSTADGAIHLWDVTSGVKKRVIQGPRKPCAVVFSPDGKSLAVSTMLNFIVRIWDVETGKEVHHLEGHEPWAESVAFSPDGKLLVCGTLDGSLHLWDLATGNELPRKAGHHGPIRAIAGSSDGQSVATVGADYMLRIWQGGREVRRIDLRQSFGIMEVVGLRPSLGFGKELVIPALNGTYHVFDPETGKELRRFGTPTVAHSIAMTPTGERVATASDSEVRLWELATGRQLIFGQIPDWFRRSPCPTTVPIWRF